MKDIDAHIKFAVDNLVMAEENLEKAQSQLRAWLCMKYQCAPGQRVLRTDTKKRSEWIVVKVELRLLSATDYVKDRPWVLARPAALRNSGNPHYSKNLGWNWRSENETA